jgi:hypothetical protein
MVYEGWLLCSQEPATCPSSYLFTICINILPSVPTSSMWLFHSYIPNKTFYVFPFFDNSYNVG